MARPRTSARVHAAVIAIVTESGYASLTMEGIAARAGVSKQTLYRSWPSTGAILFDALLARSTTDAGTIAIPDTGDLAADLVALITATIEEMTGPSTEPLLRAVVAEIQTDDVLADELRTRLLDPQLHAVESRLKRGGVSDPEAAVELLYGAVFHRWLLRTKPFTAESLEAHVARTMSASATTSEVQR